MQHRAPTLSSFGRRCGYASLGLLFAVLVGCGGGGDDAQPRDGDADDAVAVSVTAFSGVPDDVAETSMRVSAVQGVPRPGNLNSEGRYVAKLDQMTGPFIAAVPTRDAPDGKLYLVAITNRYGPLNVTPLTHLAVAQVLGRDPVLIARDLGVTGTPALAPATEAALLAAQPQVRRYLQRRFGFALPDVGDFFHGAYSPRAGHPMHDAIVALNARLTQDGTDVYAVAADLAAVALACSTERLAVTQGGVESDFCPGTKSTQTDAVDTTITNYAFNEVGGAVLTVRGRGSDVLSATLQQPSSGPSFTCSGAGCAGLTLGTPAGDQSRPVVFTNVQLGGATGMLVLSGTLQAPPPGAFFPPLGCPASYYYLADAANQVTGACPQPSTDFLGLGFGNTLPRGATRRAYTFTGDGSVTVVPEAAQLEVVTDGDSVVSVLVQDLDPGTGLPRTLWKCRGSECANVTLGPVRDDPDIVEQTVGVPGYVYRQRLITIADQTLPALNPDGTPSAAAPLTVRGSLDTAELIVPPAEQPSPRPCGSLLQRLLATLGDEDPVEICPPGPNPDVDPAWFLTTGPDVAGNLRYQIQSQYSASFADGYGAVVLTTDATSGAILRATYNHYLGGDYLCEGAACTGITVGPANGAGERGIVFADTVLQELESGGLRGERTVTVTGSFTAPPPPP